MYSKTPPGWPIPDDAAVEEVPFGGWKHEPSTGKPDSPEPGPEQSTLPALYVTEAHVFADSSQTICSALPPPGARQTSCRSAVTVTAAPEQSDEECMDIRT
jgi:hypothetical protein